MSGRQDEGAPGKSGRRAARLTRASARGYLITLASVALATGLTLALQRLLGAEATRVPFALFYGAVFLSAWYGGRGPGILTIALSAPVASYFFLPPFRTVTFEPGNLIQASIFVTVSLLIVSLIDKSRRGDKVLRRRERELTDFVENATVGLHWVGADGTILWANRAELEMLGYTPEEYVGRNIAEFHADPAVIEDILHRLSGREALHNYEARLRRKDGHVRYVLINSDVMWGDGGEFIHTRCFTRDITDRIAAERAVRESEERYRDLFENANDIVYTLDLEGNLISMNKAGQRALGYRMDELLGRPVAEIVAPEQTGQMHEMLARKLEGDEQTTYDVDVAARDGRRLTLEISSRLVREDGRPVGVQGIARDVTERNRVAAELSRLAAIVESSDDAIISKTLGGIVTSWNAAAERMYGYGADEIVGRHISLLAPPDRAEEIEEILRRLGAGERVEHHETVRVRKDGSHVDVGITVSPVKDAAGRVVGASTIARDITERRRVAELLRRSERQLQLVTDNAPVFISYCDTSERFRFVNKPYADRFGLTPEKIVGRSIAEVVGLEAYETFRRHVLAALEGRRVEFESEIHYESIGRHYIHAEYVPHLSDDGSVLGFVAVITDITERKRVEAALRKSEERYRALAEAMPQIVWTARPDGYYDYYNSRWFEYTGMRLEQTEGWGWQPVLHPDDVERCIRRWATAIETGEEYTIEYRFRRASDGQYRWHLGRGVPLRDATGRIVKWFGTSTDIHDQKLAQERQRFLAEAGALLSSSLDYEATLERLARLSLSSLADHCIVDLVVEDGHVRRVVSTHLDPSKEELMRALREHPPEMRSDVGVPKVLRTGQPEVFAVADDEALRAMARGTRHLELLRHLGLRSFMTVPLIARERIIGALTLGSTEAGRKYGASDLVFAEDLARRAALAIDNARLYREARESNRLKDEFLATLSHELRTPLTPVIGWTHMIRSGHLSETEVGHGMGVIDRSAQSLARLINDLLDMSSILSGKMSIERAPVRLDEVIAAAAETVRPHAAARKIRLDLALCGDGGGGRGAPVISGDRTRLEQVFWNLLTNAVKFSREGGRVSVRCATENGHARVEVADDGAGIEPEFMPYVFERFRQADQKTTRAHGGLGIGLALVKSFVEAHGGTTAAESEGGGRGSCFTVTLPLHASSAALPHPAAPKPAPDELCAGDECHVLVIDDARDTLDMLKVVLTARGYHPTMCGSADEALRVAAEMWFDIIVSDIGLPKVDGYELIRRLRELPHLRETPAVALTGYASDTDAAAALAAGFDIHIPKPVDPTMLADAIERLLKQKSGPAAGHD